MDYRICIAGRYVQDVNSFNIVGMAKQIVKKGR